LPDLRYPWLRPATRGGKKHRVAIGSYQLMASGDNTERFVNFVQEVPTVLIADEAQMMYEGWDPDAEGDSWGHKFDRVAQACLDAGGYLFIMSGGLLRHNGERILRVPYRQGERSLNENPEREYPLSDVVYTLADGQAERAIIRLDGDRYEGRTRFQWNGGHWGFNLEDEDVGYESKKLLTYLGEEDVWKTMYKDCVTSWSNYNSSMGGYNSRILGIAYNKEQARMHQYYLEQMGIPTLLALDDEKDIHARIRQFRKGLSHYKAMVTVGMAYIGLDVRNFSHMVYLSNHRSLPYCLQAFHRITRFDPDAPRGWEYQIARFFIPSDPRMLAIYAAIMAMQHPGVTSGELLRPGGPSDGGNGGEGPRGPGGSDPSFIPQSAEVTGKTYETQNRFIEEHEGVARLLKAVPALHGLSRADVEKIWKEACNAASARGNGDTGEEVTSIDLQSQDEGDNQDQELCGALAEEDARAVIQELAKKIDAILAERYGKETYPPGTFNRHVVRRYNKSRLEMGTGELLEVRDYAEEYLRRLRSGDGVDI
jgi:hypothetical protein